MESYGDLMFTPSVIAEQEAAGARRALARAYATPRFAEIGRDEAAFIATCTTAYLASVSETGWPYVQHRGGPPGFLAVLNPTQIAFADYPGNNQFITVGNLKAGMRLSALLIDYARQARLKLVGTAELSTEGSLLDRLRAPGGAAVRRATVLTVQALDWNCPKYITKRYSEPEIEQILGPKLREMGRRIAELEQENAALRAAAP